MEGIYPVAYHADTVGKVQLEKIGMYYFAICCCCLPENQTYRLYADVNAQQLQLGILIPEQKHYVLRVHIPCRKFCDNNTSFYVQSECESHESACWLDARQKITCLSKLEDAYLQRNGARCQIIFKKEQQLIARRQ